MLQPMKQCLNLDCGAYGIPSVRNKFCSSCADELQEMSTCPSCGEQILPRDNYCGMCAAEINAQETAENEATQN